MCMATTVKLFMLLVGCKPAGRYTEQHDVFFGIAASLKELVPHLYDFWPEAKGNLHIDAWREVSRVGDFSVKVIEKENEPARPAAQHLFFLNLGGYKPHEFEEYHYKLLTVAENSGAAIQLAKNEWFYRHVGFEGAVSHIDDKYGLDVDDIYAVKDILAPAFKALYRLEIDAAETAPDAIHLGYLPLSKLKN